MSADMPDDMLDVEVEAPENREPVDRTADRPESHEDEETQRFVVFHIGEKPFAVSVEAVKSIVKVSDRTRVPRTSAAIDGIMDLRGEITAIVEPRVHFAVERDPSPVGRQRIVVFDRPADKQGVGIRVDGVDGVELFPIRHIIPDEHADVANSDADHPLVTAVIRRMDGEHVVERIGLLDIKALIKASGQATA